ncbi:MULTISPECIES: redoxin domain-containing protein [unclassified Paenibacillus]|uniref:redoxin domain-containing protein n=1 Tax=unclassified Paenibacillus TaxID=185978 RepID=UPI001AE710A7|nr:MULTISPECIES: redoxin domain-containing protein [unclassified Paenibacillus]MBP1155218.1 peroxiredoxin [Paenibacillus sp. PvP091]MBP1169398.1 peroxiredoxin [Paenibacillus sp. PvR098]MBP2440426.1 peroxiredoxin [Paenibacillus sp. PvP052]
MGKHRQWIQIAIFAVIVAIGALTLTSQLFSNDKKPTQGAQAPNFKLLGLDGKTYELSDYKGRAVIVNFWGTFCEPCRDEMPALERQHAKWGDQLAVLGLNLDEPRVTVENFVSQYKVTFPILMDKNEEMRKRYGVSQYPTTFFVGPDGIVSQIRIGEMDEPFIEQTVAAMLK